MSMDNPRLPDEKKIAVDSFTAELKQVFPKGSLLEQCLQRRNILEREEYEITNQEREEALRSLRPDVKINPDIMRRMGQK